MRVVTGALLALVLAGLRVDPAAAGCGCDKPPPARAAVRPFVGYRNQLITLFDDRIAPGPKYDVQFTSASGVVDWSRAKGAMKKDLADGAMRRQLRVRVGDVPLGPCTITVWLNGAPVLSLTDDHFTVTAAPIMLHDFSESVWRNDYQAAVGRDGTVYIPLDVREVDTATAFAANAVGYPLAFGAQGVAIYNEQGFLMQLLDPSRTDLFRVTVGDPSKSTTLTYWRHEFMTYKKDHRQKDAWGPGDDPDWHADGTYHVDHDHLVIAVRGTLPNGSMPAPGSTPPFRLAITSAPSAALQ
ncbi:MAG: hypothetical protein U0807_04065 [Candidatus Binatia bacterium]